MLGLFGGAVAQDEKSWMGPRLVVEKVRIPAGNGRYEVVATILADNERAVRFLQAMAPGAEFRYLGFTEVEAIVPVRAASPDRTGLPFASRAVPAPASAGGAASAGEAA